MTPSTARELWQRVETLHAVTYFCEESRAAARTAGLKGFWMGYFGFRAAPLGAVAPGVVVAAFANFAPAMVARAIPDAWDYASPDALVVVRRHAAAASLRRLSSRIDETAEAVNASLAAVVDSANPIGRVMFSANATLPLPADPVESLWQLTTSLREHRGDSHVQILAAAGVGPCEAHLLHAAEHATPTSVLRDNRGWTEQEWKRATIELANRGLLDDSGLLTRGGTELRAWIESETDRLAAEPVGALTTRERQAVLEALDDPVAQVVGSDEIPFPNPMGLPPPKL